MDLSRALTADEREAFRARLCEAVRHRFAQLGPDGVTMRGLASDLGCSPMTPYSYFASKEDILAAVRADAFRRLADLCESAAEAADGELARAGAIGRAYLRFALSEPEAYRIMFELSQPDIRGFPDLAEQVDRARRFMAQPTEILVRRGVLAGDAAQLAEMFWAASHGVIVLHMTGKLAPETDVEGLYARIASSLMRGNRGPRFAEVEAALVPGGA
ncbi:MAG: TetR family transcriptional regulator [Alphaproteobacteria bacterium]|nr:TetR family transcriptional regulator [Alphaproteobacteria bacterium]